MPVHDDLGIRMKTYYEARSQTSLVRKMPVAIRIDGKAFHTFTKHFERPFDARLMIAMQATMKRLCESIQGCVLGYTQSDEITLILCDYKSLATDAWFDYEVQKLCSISASMATLYFNQEIRNIWGNIALDNEVQDSISTTRWRNAYKSIQNGAMFDSRCFNIPKEEVTNLIYWRQLDATRNSIQSVGQAYLSAKQLHGKSCNEIQDMLMVEKGINWNDFPVDCKRGSCCIKANDQARSCWIIDTDIPVFSGEGREYIEQRINFN